MGLGRGAEGDDRDRGLLVGLICRRNVQMPPMMTAQTPEPMLDPPPPPGIWIRRTNAENKNAPTYGPNPGSVRLYETLSARVVSEALTAGLHLHPYIPHPPSPK